MTRTQRNAATAQRYADQLTAYIAAQQGVYLTERGEYSWQFGYKTEFSVLLNGRRIELNTRRTNHPLNELLLKVCNIRLYGQISRSAIVRVIYFADGGGR